MEYATKVQNLLTDPPEENPYKKLKEQLIFRIADSPCQKIWQLLTMKELGDSKPTQLFHKMQQLLGGRTPINNPLLCELFLQWLLSNVHMIMASADDMNIGKLAKMADRIVDVATPMVTAVSTSTEDDCIHKLFCKELNTAFPAQHRSRLQSLSNSSGGGLYYV